MQIKDIINVLETLAPPSLQEDYDNCGLITGDPQWHCTGALTCLDVTGDVVQEAIEKKLNLIVAHHPVVYKGLKKITGKTYVEQTIITAIKNDMAIYAIHTNLDNIITGVNGRIADKLDLINRSVLVPKKQLLRKLVVFVPVDMKDALLNALFDAGAGNIGNYSECSFVTTGTGSFKAGSNTHPYTGEIGQSHHEEEARAEVIFPEWMQAQIIAAMLRHHPYEEVAYDLYNLENEYPQTGSGLLGELADGCSEAEMLEKLAGTFSLTHIRHTAFTGKTIKKVAVCGGAGSSLTKNAINSGADIYITADIKYHEFFDAEGKLLLTDIGHYESEQFTRDLLFDILTEKFPNFAVLKTGMNTNPVRYFTA